MKQSMENSFFDATKNNRSSYIQYQKTQTPGPGTYRIVSEFGKYDFNNFVVGSGDSSALISPHRRAQSALGIRSRKKTPVERQD
jgi:hypothetical protein